MGKKLKAVKLADIAEALDVSIVTVSKALSDQSGVSEELRAKIKTLADEMGYKPLAAMRTRKEQNKSYNIGVLIPGRYVGFYESFYWKLYQEVINCGMTKGCFTLLELLYDEDEKSETLPKLVTENKADGLIIIGRPGSDYASFLSSRTKLPLVFLDFYGSDISADCVISDSFYGSYLMTKYLLDRGHRDICFVGTLFATESITDRYMGYCKALMERGIKPDTDRVVSDRNIETGISTEPDDIVLPDKMPTAFVCNCDTAAAIMAMALRSKGYRVPEDVSIVGFDNYLPPADRSFEVTTYEVDVHEMARIAINTMVRKIGGESYQKGMRIVEGQLIERNSVKTIK